MKWIGQHIYDLVSRFRNNVFVESTLAIDNNSNDQVTLDINAGGNINTNIIDIYAPKLEGAAAIYIDSSLSLAEISVDRDVSSLEDLEHKGMVYLSGKKASITGVGDTHTMIGIRSDIRDNATNVGTSNLTNLVLSSNMANDGGTTSLIGIQNTLTGASDTLVGYLSNVVNGSPDIKLVSSADATDYFTIATGAVGATTLTTVDTTVGATAHFEIAADGDITLDSAGQIKLEPVAGNNILLDGTVTIDGGAVGGLVSLTSSADLAIVATGNDITVDSDTFTMTSSTADQPIVKLLNTTDDDQAGQLIFEKLRDDDAVAQGQNLGEIWFRGQNDAQESEDYAYIVGEIDVSTEGEESGILKLGVAGEDGSNRTGLILTGGSEASEVDVTLGLGANSVVTIPGAIQPATVVASAYLDADTAHLSGAQTFTGTKTLNSFKGTGGTTVTNILDEDAMGSDSATALATQQSIKAYVDAKYASSIISFLGQATMVASGNWIGTGKAGISSHAWNKDYAVNTETNGTSMATVPRQWGQTGIRVPFACVVDGISCMISNTGGNRQTTVGLFFARAADGTTAVDWGDADSTEPILQIHADANNESGSYTARPSHAEVTGSDIAMAAGDVFYPAIKLTGITSSGDTDNIYVSFSVHIKTLIA